MTALVVLLTELVPGGQLPDRVSGELAGLKAEVFQVPLEPGEFFQAHLETVSGQAEIELLDPTGRRALRAETSELLGPRISIAFLATTPGAHRLHLRARGRPGQRCPFELRLSNPRRPSSRDFDQLRVLQVLEGAGRDLDTGLLPNPKLLEEARERAGQLGDAVSQVQLTARLAQVRERQGELDEAVGHYESAAALAAKLGSTTHQAVLLEAAGALLFGKQQYEDAEPLFTSALLAVERSGEPLLRAKLLGDLGRNHVYRRNFGEALSLYRRSLELAQWLGNREAMTRSFMQLAVAHHSLGQFRKALDFLRRAEKLAPKEDPWILCEKGRAYLQLEDWPEGERQLKRCLQGRTAEGDAQGSCLAFNLLGNLYRRSGRLSLAVESYESAKQVAERSRITRGLNEALANLGRVAVEMGQPQKAIPLFRSAREVLHDPLAQLWLQVDEARAELRAGECERAIELVEATEAGLEKQRVSSDLPARRRETLGMLNSLYSLRVSILMAPLCRSRNPGVVGRGFELADASRARTLLDELLDSGQGRLRSAAETFSLRDIQRELLSPDTQMLFFLLGSEQSQLWLIGPDSIHDVSLPRGREIGWMARALHGAWSSPPGGKDAGRKEALALSRTLLAEISPRLQSPRLVVVSDGELQKIPFAALPDPGHPGSLLIDRHEVVHLPSASFLLHLRNRLRPPAPPRRGIAVFADPLFESPGITRGASRWRSLWPFAKPSFAVDPGRIGRPRRAASPGESSLLDPSPLPQTRVEAHRIRELFPRSSRIFLGPEATLERATSGALSSFTVLHYATHGILNLDNPELSGLELAHYDAQGRRIGRSTLFADQIQKMTLGAELVVLSACQTALGQLIEGEGMIGLSRAFFNAGASRVIVSLWNVEDDSTAQLMPLFYRALKEGAAPSAALRRAQNQLRQIPGYEHPYHWAAFIHEGEWRPINNSLLSVSSLEEAP